MAAITNITFRTLLFGLLASTLLASLVTAQGNFNAGGYPLDSRTCMSTAAVDSGCNLDTNAQGMNECLCSSQVFFTTAATCITTNDATDLLSVYNIMYTACQDTSTPLEWNYDEFIEAGKSSNTATTATTTAAITTATSVISSSTATPPSQNEGGAGHLSSGAVAGIGVAGSLAGIIAAIVAVYLCCCRSRQSPQ